MFSELESEVENDTLVTIVSEKHCWRTLGGLRTRSYFSAREAMRSGCHLQEITFVLRHPEVMLCDLSNLEPPLSLCSAATIERAYRAVIEVAPRLLHRPDQRVITGEGLQPELAISGASDVELRECKARILAAVFEGNSVRADGQHEPTNTRGLTRTRRMVDAPERVAAIYNEFCAFYGQFIAPEHWSKTAALHQHRIYDDHIIWKQIEALGDYKLFIVSAGLPIGFAYVQSTGDDRVYFTEVHRQNDPTMLHRTKPFDTIYPTPRRSKNTWVVIDKAYTGGSIRLAAQRIRQLVGYDAEVLSVALFPKSLDAVASADYVVYAGRLIKVRDELPHLTAHNWHIELLRVGSP